MDSEIHEEYITITTYYAINGWSETIDDTPLDVTGSKISIETVLNNIVKLAKKHLHPDEKDRVLNQIEITTYGKSFLSPDWWDREEDCQAKSSCDHEDIHECIPDFDHNECDYDLAAAPSDYDSLVIAAPGSEVSGTYQRRPKPITYQLKTFKEVLDNMWIHYTPIRDHLEWVRHYNDGKLPFQEEVLGEQ